MKIKFLLPALALSIASLHAGEIVVSHYADEFIEVPAATDLHITGNNNVLPGSTVNLTADDSWLFFDNIRPSVVVDNYKDNILIKGAALLPGENAEVRVDAHGTVIIPHTADFQPLEVFTVRGLRGDSRKYAQFVFYKGLDDFDNAIRSFRLKRGYMATLANNPDGTGYSRVFIADEGDLEVEVLPDVLDRTVSFIRVFKWDRNTKKGWCGSNPDQADLLNCTWYYSWSADKVSTYNYQYVPIRQNLGWPGFDEICGKENVCHLLGYNEPDRSDQSDVTVEEAIAQWPELLKSGLRLGSPVPSNPGNGNGWLYRFLAKCDSLNYRVDYAVVHAYWGGKSPSGWYKDLKQEYEKCGRRPLWITEWNNGANWTSEYWPDDPDAQKQKQLSDLKGILHVLDTCSFVERYSIYDWVNAVRINSNNDTKTVIRAMIWDGELTPAGEYYRDNNSAIAFSKKQEVIPGWNLLDAGLTYNLDQDTVTLIWNDPNEGLVSEYVVERSAGTDAFEMIATLPADVKNYRDTIDRNISGDVSYRIRLALKSGLDSPESNIVRYNVTSGANDYQYGTAAFDNTDWSYFRYKKNYSSAPVVLFGIPSYTDNTPVSQRLKSTDEYSFQFHVDTWQYLNKTSFNTPLDISYLIMLPGKHDFEGISGLAGVVKSVGRNWKTVVFDQPFETKPAVFVSQATSRNGYATSVRIRNVTAEGFEVALQKESALAATSATITLENINYVALTPGTGSIGGAKIKVGLTEEGAVGTIYAPAKISFGDAFVNPAVFACMQTTSDDIVSTLRFNNLTDEEVRIFRQRELSEGGSPNAGSKETAGWMIIDLNENVSGISSKFNDQSVRIYPNPVGNVLHVYTGNMAIGFDILSVSGQKMMEGNTGEPLNVSSLHSGVYIIRLDGNACFRILKK